MVSRLAQLLRSKSFVVVSLFFLFTPVFAFTSPGSFSGYANDFAQVLTSNERALLEQKLAAFNASTSNQIAVVTVKSLEGDYIEHYSAELFTAWKIGTKERNNGVLLLVAVNDHKVRIEVGYGLEGALTDSISGKIIRDDIAPAFKQGNYYGGIDKAVTSIIRVTQGEYIAEVKDVSKKFPVSFETMAFFFVVAIQIFASLLARSKSWWAGGALGGVLGAGLSFWMLHLTLLFGGLLTLLLVGLGLLFDYIVSSGTFIGSHGRGPWVSGGSLGSRGGGGSSFGGFGGGRSGGGGASGGW